MSNKRYTGRVEITEIEETAPKSKNCRCIGAMCNHDSAKPEKHSVQISNLVVRSDDLHALRTKLSKLLDLI